MAAPAALFNNGAREGRRRDDHGAAAADQRLERRLRLYAAVYMMLGSMVLLRAAFPDDANKDSVVGLLLWAVALALALLSAQRRHFPLAARAAARLAQAAINGAFF